MNHLDEQLITAIEIANVGHEGQYDKAGEPYILHPLRLMSRTTDRKEQIVSVLHDLIEDTSFTLDSLVKYEFDEDIIEAVDCLTRRKDETYDQFIERISLNELATKVKLLDLEDNLDLSRLHIITDATITRRKKYKKAYEFLIGANYASDEEVMRAAEKMSFKYESTLDKLAEYDTEFSYLPSFQEYKEQLDKQKEQVSLRFDERMSK